LYGLKTFGGRYHDYWETEIHEQGWFPSKADPDVWMCDKGDDYKYLAVWVDDLLYVGKDPNGFFGLLNEKRYIVKGLDPLHIILEEILCVSLDLKMYLLGDHTHL
jgi:hypothetical protein